MESEDTSRTKRAIRRWADLRESDRLVLDDALDRLRPPEFRSILRTRLNQEFQGESCFPITPSQWEALQSRLRLVRHVRDEVTRRKESGQCEPPATS
jgi:hypothetical protein